MNSYYLVLIKSIILAIQVLLPVFEEIFNVFINYTLISLSQILQHSHKPSMIMSCVTQSTSV